MHALFSQDLMDKLTTLQQQLQEAEDKKITLQDQVRALHLGRRPIARDIKQEG